MKNMIMGSMIAAGVVALASLADLILGVPFAGYSMVMDILFIVSAGIIIYMGIDSLKDMA